MSIFRYMVHTGRNSRSILESELKSYRYYLNDNSNSYVRWKKLIFCLAYILLLLICTPITITFFFFLIPIFKSIILIWMFVPVPIIQNLMCMIKEACIWSCLNIAFTDMYSNFLVFVFFPQFLFSRLIVCTLTIYMVVSGNQKFLQTTEHIFRYISSLLVLSCNEFLLVMVFFSIPIFHYCSIICTNLYYRYDYIFLFFLLKCSYFLLLNIYIWFHII